MNLNEGLRIHKRNPETSAIRSIDSQRTLDGLVEKSLPQVQRFIEKNPNHVQVFITSGLRDRILEADSSKQEYIAGLMATQERHLFPPDLEGESLVAFIIALARQSNQ